MYNFNEHIINQLLNEYSGSEKKRTILLDDGQKYLLKFPDPIRTRMKYFRGRGEKYARFF